MVRAEGDSPIFADRAAKTGTVPLTAHETSSHASSTTGR